MRRSLERSDTIINLRNQEIATLNSRLAAKDETIAEASEQCDEFEKWWKEEEGKVSDRDKIIAQLESQLSDSDFDSAGKAGEVVSWLRKTVGKALPKQVTVKEVQKILEGKDN